MTRKEALEAVAVVAARIDAFAMPKNQGLLDTRMDLRDALRDLSRTNPSPPPGAVKVRVAVVMEPSGEYNATGWTTYDGHSPDDEEIVESVSEAMSDTAQHVGWLVGYFVPPAEAPEVEGEEEAP